MGGRPRGRDRSPGCGSPLRQEDHLLSPPRPRFSRAPVGQIPTFSMSGGLRDRLGEFRADATPLIEGGPCRTLTHTRGKGGPNPLGARRDVDSSANEAGAQTAAPAQHLPRKPESPQVVGAVPVVDAGSEASGAGPEGAHAPNLHRPVCAREARNLAPMCPGHHPLGRGSVPLRLRTTRFRSGRPGRSRGKRLQMRRAPQGRA